MRANFATQAARNLHAFELLVGPYAVAHLRLTQQILAEGGQMPPDGVHVYLTDTLESPLKPLPQFPFMYKELAEEHKRAQEVKAAEEIAGKGPWWWHARVREFFGYRPDPDPSPGGASRGENLGEKKMTKVPEAFFPSRFPCKQ